MPPSGSLAPFYIAGIVGMTESINVGFAYNLLVGKRRGVAPIYVDLHSKELNMIRRAGSREGVLMFSIGGKAVGEGVMISYTFL